MDRGKPGETRDHIRRISSSIKRAGLENRVINTGSIGVGQHMVVAENVDSARRANIPDQAPESSRGDLVVANTVTRLGWSDSIIESEGFNASHFMNVCFDFLISLGNKVFRSKTFFLDLFHDKNLYA